MMRLYTIERKQTCECVSAAQVRTLTAVVTAPETAPSTGVVGTPAGWVMPAISTTVPALTKIIGASVIRHI